jgi:hypothetical protein
MKTMRKGFILLIGMLLLCSCKRTQTVQNANIVVSVNGRSLNRADVERAIPHGTSHTDSLLMAENYIEKWVKDALIYELALRNLDDEKAEIEQLVDEYRYSLLRYRYQERLIKEKLSAEVRESDKRNFYEENQQQFILDKALVKGLFLKIPIDAPGLQDVKIWYRSTSEEELEKIEKYSVQNAIIYDYFYDRWVDFNEVIANIPVRITDTNAFLKDNQAIQAMDSSYCYLLNIKEYLPVGDLAPYEYAEPQIVEMLINQKKMTFLRNFEDRLYNDAIRKGDVVFNTVIQ